MTLTQWDELVYIISLIDLERDWLAETESGVGVGG